MNRMYIFIGSRLFGINFSVLNMILLIIISKSYVSNQIISSPQIYVLRNVS